CRGNRRPGRPLRGLRPDRDRESWWRVLLALPVPSGSRRTRGGRGRRGPDTRRRRHRRSRVGTADRVPDPYPRGSGGRPPRLADEEMMALPEIVGNEELRGALTRAVRAGTLPQSLLLH